MLVEGVPAQPMLARVAESVEAALKARACVRACVPVFMCVCVCVCRSQVCTETIRGAAGSAVWPRFLNSL